MDKSLSRLEIVSETPPMEQVAALYAAAALRRPVRDLPRMERMFAGSNVVRAAWDGSRLVGLLRGWTDGAFDGWVSDLAVHPHCQSLGVGRALLASLDEFGTDIQWGLFASPLAREYYGRQGWKLSDVAWLRSREGWDPGEPLAWRERHLDLVRLAWEEGAGEVEPGSRPRKSES